LRTVECLKSILGRVDAPRIVQPFKVGLKGKFFAVHDVKPPFNLVLRN
jgi:hypothetical protein